MAYRKRFDQVTGRQVLEWIYEPPDEDPIAKAARLEYGRRMVEGMRPTNCHVCGHPSKEGQTGCGKCSRSFVE